MAQKQAPLDNNACKCNKNNTTQFNTTLPNYNTSQKCVAFQKHELSHHGNNQPFPKRSDQKQKTKKPTPTPNSKSEPTVLKSKSSHKSLKVAL